MPRLIVNADDLGYTPGVNQAVHELARAGAVSSATWMARGAAAHEALASGGPPPAIGCHVVLVDGLPSAPPHAIASLLAPGGGEPRFRSTLGAFARDLSLGRISEHELEREAVAQIRTLQAAGIHPTHLDTHKHTHMFPPVLRAVLRAAQVCGVTAIRNPFEPAWARRATLRAGGAPGWARRAQVAFLASLHAPFQRAVRQAGLATTDGALGVLATGSLDAPVLAGLLRAAARQEGTWELVCHPAYRDHALARSNTRLQSEREIEREALAASPHTRGPLELITFAHLRRPTAAGR